MYQFIPTKDVKEWIVEKKIKIECDRTFMVFMVLTGTLGFEGI